jgi:hypothetical protein
MHVKSLKLFFINALILLIGVALMTGALSQDKSEAARLEKLPALEVQGLKDYRGQYLTVYYAIGSRPFISPDDSKITLSQVKEARSVYITDDSIKLTSTEIEKEGFRPSYNIVMFIVSKQPNYSWVNADGTVPQGLSEGKNRSFSLISSLNKTKIDKSLHHNMEETLHVSLATR